jgi:hypothetical protein
MPQELRRGVGPTSDRSSFRPVLQSVSEARVARRRYACDGERSGDAGLDDSGVVGTRGALNRQRYSGEKMYATNSPISSAKPTDFYYHCRSHALGINPATNLGGNKI